MSSAPPYICRDHATADIGCRVLLPRPTRCQRSHRRSTSPLSCQINHRARRGRPEIHTRERLHRPDRSALRAIVNVLFVFVTCDVPQAALLPDVVPQSVSASLRSLLRPHLMSSDAH